MGQRWRKGGKPWGSEVTITRPDGETETRPANNDGAIEPQPTKPLRRAVKTNPKVKQPRRANDWWRRQTI